MKYDFINDGEFLVINRMIEEDTGVYKCIAENVFGKAEQVINVTIGTFSTDILVYNYTTIHVNEGISLVRVRALFNNY